MKDSWLVRGSLSIDQDCVRPFIDIYTRACVSRGIRSAMVPVIIVKFEPTMKDSRLSKSGDDFIRPWGDYLGIATQPTPA